MVVPQPERAWTAESAISVDALLLISSPCHCLVLLLQLTVHVSLPGALSYSCLASALQQELAARVEVVKEAFR